MAKKPPIERELHKILTRETPRPADHLPKTATGREVLEAFRAPVIKARKRVERRKVRKARKWQKKAR